MSFVADVTNYLPIIAAVERTSSRDDAILVYFHGPDGRMRYVIDDQWGVAEHSSLFTSFESIRQAYTHEDDSDSIIFDNAPVGQAKPVDGRIMQDWPDSAGEDI